MSSDPSLTRLINESTYPATLALLLEADDIEKAKKSLNNIIKAMESRINSFGGVVSSMPSGDYKDTLQGVLQKSIDAVKEQKENVVDGHLDANTINGITQSIDSVSAQLRYLIFLNTNLMQYLAKIVIAGDLHKGEDKAVPLEVYLEETDGKEGVFLVKEKN